MFNFQLVRQCVENYESGTMNKTVAPHDPMYNEWYFSVGRSCMEVVLAALMASQVQDVKRILDLPCGYGRALRHLAAAFPDARIDACDLDAAAVDFCNATFGAKPVYSTEELTSVDFETEYDLIWVGSLFTHTSESVTRRWMGHLAKFLSPRGIVVATFHGRWSVHVHSKASPYIAEESWRQIHKGFTESGYGYNDYARSENHPYISGGYGISLVKPNAALRIVESIEGIRIFSYMERGWGDHQDVVVFGRPGYDEPWPGMK